MVQVLFDNKNIHGILTNDKIVHLMWPGFVEAETAEFDFFTDALGANVFGHVSFRTAATAEDEENPVLAAGAQVLYHHPFNPLGTNKARFLNKSAGSFHADDKQMLFYRDTQDIVDGRPVLKPLRFVKFPRLHYDQDSDQLLLFYWTNVPAAALDTIIADFDTRELDGEDVTNDEANYSIIEQAAEPFTSAGIVDDTLQRVFVFTKAELANLYDDETGVIRHQPSMFLFERPRLVLKPGLFDTSNTAEPVLDVHTGAGQSIFLEFVPIP